MKNKLLILLSLLIVILGVTVPSVAQDEWPEECTLPDLEEAMSAANEALANGDKVAYLFALLDTTDTANTAFVECFETLAKSDDVMLEVELNLAGANLENTDLRNANLQETHLRGANLTGADLRGANLRNAMLCWGHPFSSVCWGGTDLQWADLSNANLEGAWLSGGNLFSARLTNANLEGAWLDSVNLFSANLTNANLQETWFFLSILEGAWLNGADLRQAWLVGANLQGADLSNANLEGASLAEALLMSANLQGAILPDGTNWTPETDMARFTDPEHPDFWDPCVELDERPWYSWYCADEESE